MIPEGALHIIRALRLRGHQAVLAGGCVRDLVLGQTPRDWDIATDADPETVMALFPVTIPVGAKFGIVLVRLDDGEYEVARFRRDGPYLDGRHPSQVTFADAAADARRRDFTINGMFYDPEEGRVVDLVGGRDDLAAKLVRAIGRPEERFAEDHLRALRAVRFAARLGFQIEAQTAAAIRAAAPGLARISPERVRDELTAILTEGAAGQGMQMLLELGLLAQVLPEVAAMDGVPQAPEHHPEGDVWTHVRLMLERLPPASPALAWGALLHDVGKPLTLTRADRIRFHNHDQVGAGLVDAIAARLRLPHALAGPVRQMAAQHMRFRHVRQMRESKLRRFLRQPGFAELLELHRLDCVASHGQLDLYEFCREKVAASGEEQLRPPRLVNGHDLIELGGVPGPRFREILEQLEDEQLEGRLAARDQALARARQLLGEGGAAVPGAVSAPECGGHA
ncbi:MAG: CCA tRNA nucleotidyltransferase [Gemmatimonadota bacterium]